MPLRPKLVPVFRQRRCEQTEQLLGAHEGFRIYDDLDPKKPTFLGLLVKTSIV